MRVVVWRRQAGGFAIRPSTRRLTAARSCHTARICVVASVSRYGTTKTTFVPGRRSLYACPQIVRQSGHSVDYEIRPVV